MILFYNKRNGNIIGVVEGRVHPKEILEKVMMIPGHLKKSEVGKYIVPFKTKYKEIEEPITEMRITDKKTMRVEKVVVGKKKVKVGAGMKPDVPFANLISDFESGKKRIYDYKVKLEKGEVVDFVLK